MEATISADVIRSTSLSKNGMIFLQEKLEDFVYSVGEDFRGCWGRVVRGDGLEFALSNPRDLLRIVLLLRCHIKTAIMELQKCEENKIDKRLHKFGIRIAAAIGDLRTNDNYRGIIDGNAIYESGRALQAMKIGDSLSIACSNSHIEPCVRALFLLTHHILTRATAKQCQVLSLKLKRVPDKEIAKLISISRVGVYLHLKSIGWEAINEALKCYELTSEFYDA